MSETGTDTPIEHSRVRRTVNRTLARAVGYELRRAPVRLPARVGEQVPEPMPDGEIAARVRRALPGDRLLVQPGFVLSSVRSGSTLLRMMLNSHPEICSPHELHLRRIGVELHPKARYSLGELGLDDTDLRYLVWDRLLHRELARSGKRRYVNKTPNDALIWDQIAACWPDARFIHLRRHPGAVFRSWYDARGPKGFSERAVAEDLVPFAVGMAQAHAARGGLIVRYEDLTTDPEGETRRICEYLGVEWSSAMLAYGAATHGGQRRGLGDWSDTLRSGRIRPAEPPGPETIPEVLRPVAREWGYLD